MVVSFSVQFQFVYKMHSMCFQSQFYTSLHFNYPVKEFFVWIVMSKTDDVLLNTKIWWQVHNRQGSCFKCPQTCFSYFLCAGWIVNLLLLLLFFKNCGSREFLQLFTLFFNIFSKTISFYYAIVEWQCTTPTRRTLDGVV